MKRVLVASVALLAMIGSASAADMARRAMPTKAPVYAPAVYNWTGFYAGINAGGGWGRSNFSGVPTTGNFDVDGGMVGGTVGYNWQYNQIVFGVEGDIDWANIRGSAVCGGLTCSTRNNWLGTARGRVGYAFDRFLPYVTGGLAVGDVKANTTGFPGDSETRAGWTVGAGLEAALGGRVTAKLEYLYADLGNFNCGTACTATPPQNVKFNTNIVRAGLNVRF